MPNDLPGPSPRVETRRLVLRRWTEDDLDAFAAMNADPDVMRHYPSTLTRAASDHVVERLERHFDQHGFGIWAVEHRSRRTLIGFTGLQHVPFEARFTPAVEIAWRLARSEWGHGYATEAAEASLQFARAELGLAEVVAMAVPANTRSIALMERIGMTRNPADDFDNPLLPAGSHLRWHVLYRIAAADIASGRPFLT